VFNPRVGLKKSLISVSPIKQGFDLNNFMGGVEITLGGRKSEGGFVKEEIKTDFVGEVLGVRAPAETEEFEEKNGEKAGKPEAIGPGDDQKINIIMLVRVVHAKGAGKGDEPDEGNELETVSDAFGEMEFLIAEAGTAAAEFDDGLARFKVIVIVGFLDLGILRDDGKIDGFGSNEPGSEFGLG
jgi:hypothetical protein